MNQAVFLDRDGTLMEDVHYCDSPGKVKLLPGVESLAQLKDFKLVVITNQSGIARGYFSEAMLNNIHRKLRRLLSEYNIWLDLILFCPHHPDDKCDCRKPGVSLFKKAASLLEIDFTKSFAIGDLDMDYEAAQALNMPFFKVSREHSMKEAVAWILNRTSKT